MMERNEPGGTTAELGELWGIAARWRWALAAGALLGAAAGAGLALREEAVYQASVVIRVDEKRLDLPTLGARIASATGNQLGAEMEVLRSRSLAALVVDSLGLRLRVEEPRATPREALFAAVRLGSDGASGRFRFTREGDGRFRVEERGEDAAGGSYAPGEPVRLGEAAEVVLAPSAAELASFEVAVLPRADAVAALTRGLRVRRPGADAAVIRVEYRGGDPRLVREVPDLLASAFIDLRRSTQRTEARSTIAFLRQQLDTIGQQLAATERELLAFREANGVVDLETERVVQVRRLAELQGERAALEVERASLAELVDEVRRAPAAGEAGAASGYRRLVAYPTLLRSPAATELVRSLVQAEDQRTALLTRRSAADPDVQVLAGRIRELEGELQAAVTTYLRGVENQVRAVDAELGRQRGGLDRIPARELRFARLARQATLLEEVYGQLQTRLKEAEVAHAAEDPSVRVIDPAVATVEAAGARRLLTGGGLALAGLLAAFGVAVVREFRDESLRSRADLQQATGLPVLAAVPRIGPPRARLFRGALPGPRGRLRLPAPPAPGSVVPVAVDRPDPSSPAGRLVAEAGAPGAGAEAYRRLLVNLRWAAGTERKVWLFTSPLPGDGKTTTAANFALTLAQDGRRVVLVDADLRRASVGALFHSGAAPGLTELLTEPIPPPEVIRAVEAGNGGVLHYIPAGATPAAPADLMDAPRFQALLDWLREEYEVVVIDSPPLNVVPDAAVLSPRVDGVVVVVRAAVTPASALEFATSELRAAGAPVLGTVLNDFVLRRDAGYDGSYRWYAAGEAYYAASGAARSGAAGARCWRRSPSRRRPRPPPAPGRRGRAPGGCASFPPAAGRASTSGSCGRTGGSSSSWSGATSRCATRRPCWAPGGPCCSP
jgi:polysaccharide biosynthesis transport protein